MTTNQLQSNDQIKTLGDIQNHLQGYVDTIEDEVNRLIAKKGNSIEECQQVLLLSLLGQIGHAINGITEEDLV